MSRYPSIIRTTRLGCQAGFHVQEVVYFTKAPSSPAEFLEIAERHPKRTHKAPFGSRDDPLSFLPHPLRVNEGAGDVSNPIPPTTKIPPINCILSPLFSSPFAI